MEKSQRKLTSILIRVIIDRKRVTRRVKPISFCPLFILKLCLTSFWGNVFSKQIKRQLCEILDF